MTGKFIIGGVIFCCITLFLPFMVLLWILRWWLLALLLHLAGHHGQQNPAGGHSAHVKG